MTTQLTVGAMGGVIGLRYESLPFVLATCGVSADQHLEVFNALQIMEQRLVRQLNEKK